MRSSTIRYNLWAGAAMALVGVILFALQHDSSGGVFVAVGAAFVAAGAPWPDLPRWRQALTLLLTVAAASLALVTIIATWKK